MMIDVQTAALDIRARGFRLAVCAYSATIFLSAALLFFVEPMFARMVLPMLGGSSAVWSVAMVVFQGLLLAGYVYAHLLTWYFGLRRAVLIHVLLLATATLVLPIAVHGGFGAPPPNGVSLWLIGLFLASVGLPCFALSANAPLLQAWFARGGARQSASAYFLYRASNLGSFAILLAYPFAIEPTFGLVVQSRLWSAAYVVLVSAVGMCGALALRSSGAEPAAIAATGIDSGLRAQWRDRFAWVALAFVPSGLLVAVTAHIATDVASAPFLWIVPLALYLLTFVFAFSEKQAFFVKAMLALQPFTAALLVVLFLWNGKIDWSLALFGHLGAFFVAAMVCHARLYARRPDASRLTDFYAWMSLGGVLGGAFAALAAPQIFTTIAEYPLLAFAALLARADVWNTPRAIWAKEGAFVAALTIVLGVAFVWSGSPVSVFAAAVMALAGLMALQGRNPVRLLGLAAVLFAATNLYDPSQSIVYRARSFYGAYKAVDIEGGKFRVLYHGTTAHGAEQLRDAKGAALTGRPEPLTYYYAGGPYADAIRAIRAEAGGTLNRVALVGLGVGALSCYGKPGEDWTIYELDPMIVQIAHDTRLFRSVSECAPLVGTVIGDGRLTLRAASPGIDLLILDIFSSDSVPTHMLTREAFALFKARLAPHGAIAFNISNKNMELAKVVAASAAANGMVTAVRRDARPPAGTMHMQAEIAIVTRSAADMGALHLGPGWRIAAPDPGQRVWTDDYSAILDAVIAKMRE